VNRARAAGRLRALPDLAGVAFRFEALHVDLTAGGHGTDKGAVEVVDPGRRGYAVLAGRDVSGSAPAAVVERGVATEWGLHPGDAIDVRGLGRLRVAGIGLSPDNVAFPLASTARVYVTRALVDARIGTARAPRANLALLWAHDPAKVDVLLAQARAASYGVEGLRFVTRDGVRVLLGQAAGIIVALLVAVSLVALLVAGTMLSASARAEVQRALPAIGVRRALGYRRRRVAALHAAEAVLVAAPAGALGVLAGAGLAAGPSARLLEAVNELGPGAALAPWLVLAWLAVVALVAAGATWPAWRAAGAPPVSLLRGAGVARRGARTFGGPLGLGAGLTLARPGRSAATVVVLAAATGFAALMLALGSLLRDLEHDPGTVGKRYQLTADAPADRARDVAAVPGVAAAAPRLQEDAADSFALGETLQLVAYPGDHTRFEAPPLAAGRRLRAPGEAEIGVGLAQALGIGPGGTLAVQLGGGGEARFRVVGTVRALQNTGRVAYVRPGPLLAAGAPAAGQLAVRLDPGADVGRVRRSLVALGAAPSAVGGATSSSAPFLATVATLVRVVAGIDGVVCLFALAQALALTAHERRATVAVLRALGAGRATVAAVFLGAALALAAPAVVLGLVLERLVLGPAVAHLAAGYIALPLGAAGAHAATVAGGLAAVAAAAAVWAAARAAREPVVAGLGAE
jgi:putative ABC transport system permease protein